MSKTIKDPENIISWVPKDSSLVEAKTNYVHDDGRSILKEHVPSLTVNERINVRSWIHASADPFARIRPISVRLHDELLTLMALAGRPNRFGRGGVCLYP